MSTTSKLWLGLLASFAAVTAASTPAAAQQQQRPNILFIMGDDIGWMQPSIYHRGLMVGETPNIDRIGNEGAIFMDYYAEQSCTAGRNAFFTGMHPLRTGMIPPQLPGSPSYLRPGTPALAKFLLDLGYNTGEFGKNHLGDHTDALPTAHGFQEFWGYLYHLDAMQGVSFPDINKSPTEQTIVPPCRNTPIPGVPEVPGAVDPNTTTCLTPPRPVLACTSSDGTARNQTCKDEGPLTLERSKTVDEEISAKVIDFLDRNDPRRTNKPFFIWYNPARMHITTVFSPQYEAMLGERGGKDWGINEVGMKQLDDNIGLVLKKLDDMGQANNTIVMFTTDNGAEVITFPDGGVTPFKGGKLTTWEGGMRAPLVVRWPGTIRPGTVKNQMLASLDWVPTLVNIAGGPKGNALNEQIMAGRYPGIVKTKLDGVDQTEYLAGRSEKSAREVFFYYTGAQPSAVRYKNWKFYYTMVGAGPMDGLTGATTYHWTQIANIKRDPFEYTVGTDQKSLLGLGGALAAPSTSYLYDWNILPVNCCGSRSSSPTRSSRRCRTRQATTSIRFWHNSRSPVTGRIDRQLTRRWMAAPEYGVRHLRQDDRGCFRRMAMSRRAIATSVAAAAFGLGVASAHAGPCSSEIAQFEQAVRQSAGNPNAGPMAPQSIGAQLDRQPTPGSVKRAEERAQATFVATLARAKRLDARGNRAGCTRALAAAKRMYNLQ